MSNDWELEQRAFNAAGTAPTPELQQLIKDLWKAYCDMEQRLRSQNVGQNEGPVAWLHTFHMEGGQYREDVTLSEENPFGVPGRDYDESYSVTSEPLFKCGAESGSSTVTPDKLEASQ